MHVVWGAELTPSDDTSSGPCFRRPSIGFGVAVSPPPPRPSCSGVVGGLSSARPLHRWPLQADTVDGAGAAAMKNMGRQTRND